MTMCLVVTFGLLLGVASVVIEAWLCHGLLALHDGPPSRGCEAMASKRMTTTPCGRGGRPEKPEADRMVGVSFRCRRRDLSAWRRVLDGLDRDVSLSEMIRDGANAEAARLIVERDRRG